MKYILAPNCVLM